MSLILDALNRAERERRNHGTVPDLHTHHQPVEAAPVTVARSRKSPLPFVVIAVVLVIALSTWWLTRSTENTQMQVTNVSTVQPIAIELPEAPVSNPVPVVKTEPAPVIAEPIQPLQTVAVQPAASIEPEPVATADAMESELKALYDTASQGDTSSVATSAAANLYVQAEELVQTPVPVAVQTPAPQPVKALPPAQSQIRSYDTLIDLPDIGDLPWGLRQEIPSINYARHIVDSSEHASVFINGRLWQAGAAIAPGLVIDDIYHDGVVMKFRDVRFKLRALNSWINM